GVQGAGDGDVADVVPGGVGQGALLPPAGHPPVDELRVAGEAVVRADAEPLGDAGPEALDQHVGLLDHPEDDLPALVALEVDRDGALAAVAEVGPAGGLALLDRGGAFGRVPDA